MTRERAGLLAVALFPVSALAVLPGSFGRFVVAKLLVVAVAVALAAVARPTGRLPRDLVAVAAGGGGILVLAALANDQTQAALVGRWPRYEGVAVWCLYASAAWAGARLLAQDATGRCRRALAITSAATATALGLLAVVEQLGWSPLGEADTSRTGSVLGNATDQGLVAAMLVLVVARPAARDRAPWALLGALGGSATVLLSGSRAALVVLVLGLGLQWWAAGGRRLPRWRRRTAALGLAAGVVVSLAVARSPVVERLTSTGTLTGRIELWRASWELALDHPLLGVGPSGFVDAVGRYQDQRWVDRVGIAEQVDSPHSLLLQALLAGGPALLALLLYASWRVARRARVALADDPWRAAPAAAALAYGVAMLVHFTSPASTPLALFLLGATIAVPWERPAGRSPTHGDRVSALQAAGAIALVVCFALWCRAEVALGVGVRHASDGDEVSAETSFTSAADWRPLQPDVAMIAAQSQAAIAAERAASGDTEAASAALRWSERSLAATPHSYDAGLARGVALLALGRNEDAVRQLDAVVTDHPALPDGYLHRGIALIGVGDLEGATLDLRRASELDPEDERAPDILRAITDATGR